MFFRQLAAGRNVPTDQRREPHEASLSLLWRGETAFTGTAFTGMSGLARWLSNLSKRYTFLPGLMISLFQKEFLSEENLMRARELHEIASGRGQTLAQMAIAWVLRDERVTSALIGAHSVEQLDKALETLQFTHSELNKIDRCPQEGH